MAWKAFVRGTLPSISGGIMAQLPKQRYIWSGATIVAAASTAAATATAVNTPATSSTSRSPAEESKQHRQQQLSQGHTESVTNYNDEANNWWTTVAEDVEEDSRIGTYLCIFFLSRN